MYDGAPSRSEKIWKDYDGNVTIINFSSTLHSECIENDFNSKYIQFFQKPISFSSFGEEHGIFFWQRLTDINIYTICSLIGENNITHVHIHKAIDPSQHFVECRNLLKNKISYSEWFEYESDMLNIIEKYALYISPRMYEGIGMSFIKAMSMGRCVIAVDHPTMNEYISHGETGLLFDLSHIHDIRINDFDIRKIQKNTLEYMTEGYEKFQKNLRYIPGWSRTPVARPCKNIKDSTMAQKKISVITPSFNSREVIERAVQSVLVQDYTCWEHVIVDGGSTDGTIDLLKKYPHLKWISEKDRGQADAMNKGFSLSTGDIIVYLNADDYFLPGAFSAVMAVFEKGASFVVGNVLVMSPRLGTEFINTPRTTLDGDAPPLGT